MSRSKDDHIANLIDHVVLHAIELRVALEMNDDVQIAHRSKLIGKAASEITACHQGRLESAGLQIASPEPVA